MSDYRPKYLLVDLDPEERLLPEPQGNLYAVLANGTGRYDRNKPKLLEESTMSITPGLFSYAHEPEPLYLPPHWSIHIQPEGQLYCFKEGPPLRIVTELNIQKPEHLTQVRLWLRKIEALLSQTNIKVTEHMELYILPWKGDCFYYFADYENRTIFFLETEDSSDMGIIDVATPSHLKLALEDQFWTHVEHFPMHSGGIPVKAVDDLIGVLCHALIDQSTSSVSTFSYTQEQLRDYLKILRISREHISDGHQICLVARLWHGIYQHRFLTFYGQDNARLSRDQPILLSQPQGNGIIDKLLSFVTFTASSYYFAKFNKVFVDHVAYTTTWQTFTNECLNEWRDMCTMGFAALMLHLFLLFLPGHSTLGVVSFALFGASVATSLLLSCRYRSYANKTSPFAYDYLSAIESKTSGYRWPAFMFALPYAMFIWGLGVFFTNGLFLLAGRFGLNTAITVFAFACLSFLCVQFSTSSAPCGMSWFSGFSRKAELSASEMV